MAHGTWVRKYPGNRYTNPLANGQNRAQSAFVLIKGNQQRQVTHPQCCVTGSMPIFRRICHTAGSKSLYER